MFVTLTSGDVVRVRWIYQNVKKSIVTACIIEKQIGPRDYDILAEGSTRKSKADQFVKNKGRINSLTNLFIKNKESFSKEDRTRIWTSYANMIHHKF